MSSTQNHRSSLDPTDIAIIEVLQEDGRIAMSELGRRIGLSQPATSERGKRLEERGVIAGYGARIDPVALRLGMMAIIRLRTTHENILTCLKQFSEMPQVMEVLRPTGEDCFLLKVLVPSTGLVEGSSSQKFEHRKNARPLRRKTLNTMVSATTGTTATGFRAIRTGAVAVACEIGVKIDIEPAYLAGPGAKLRKRFGGSIAHGSIETGRREQIKNILDLPAGLNACLTGNQKVPYCRHG
jgi:Lrp/AsnC family transcriptional regulator, leucine-responsive regulatory protein